MSGEGEVVCMTAHACEDGCEGLDIIKEIIAQDSVLGTLARESIECSLENKNMAALACLFIFIEQAIKLGLNRIEGSFYRLLRIARVKKLITDEEFKILDQLREIINKMFHRDQNAWFFESNGIKHPFSEEETKKLIFDDFSEICFRISYRLAHARGR